jgi:hypothetical protein
MRKAELLDILRWKNEELEQAKKDERHEEIPYMQLTINTINKLIDNENLKKEKIYEI